MNQIPVFFPVAAEFRAVRFTRGPEEVVGCLYGVNALIRYIDQLDMKSSTRQLRLMAEKLADRARDMQSRLNKVVSDGGKPIANTTGRRYLETIKRRYLGLLMAAAEWSKAIDDPAAARYLKQLAHKTG